MVDRRATSELLVKVLGANGDIAMRRPPRTSMSTADNLAITKPLKGTLALQGGLLRS
jgi:hypothetical protein